MHTIEPRGNGGTPPGQFLYQKNEKSQKSIVFLQPKKTRQKLKTWYAAKKTHEYTCLYLKLVFWRCTTSNQGGTAARPLANFYIKKNEKS